MSSNSSIEMTSLDFDSFEQSLKNFLSSQEIFKGYDFEGPNMKILMELLSYNSFKNGFLMNMLMAESFLDSAQLRNSVLSHSKELNYTPRSARSAKARVKVSFKATGDSAPYIIQKGQPFTTLVKSKSYTFTNPETIVCASTNTSFSFTTDIYEGRFLQDSYTYEANKPNQKFKITNKNIDTNSLAIVVFEDNKEIGDLYKISSTLLDVTEQSKVFFIQPTEDGAYEVLFGDGNIGRKPKDNSLVVIEYRVASGPAPNGAKRFSCDFDPTGKGEAITNFTVDLLEVAKDGADAESIESIKYYAPRHFQVQERVITAQDCEVALRTQFPEINAVHAFGGEELNPPKFGRMVVSVDIRDVNGLPDSKKQEYYKFLKRRTAFTIEPIFMEPELSYLKVDSIVRFNVNVTPASAETIKALVSDTITNYNNIYLNKFNSILRFSKLAAAIDDTDESIVSSITEVALYKKISPKIGEKVSINLDFTVPLRDDIPEKEKSHSANDGRAMYSSVFTYSGEKCILEDDGSGKVRIMKVKGNRLETISEIGTIDYENGVIAINSILIDEFFGDYMKIFVLPKDADIVVSENTILKIESDEVHLEIEELRL